MATSQNMTILLSAPRFCAGVDRAIQIVENWRNMGHSSMFAMKLFITNMLLMV